MKFFRIDLLTLLISLFILGSCKNPDSVGLPVDSSQTLQTNLIDTATILTKTIDDDSVATSSVTKAPLAYFKDPIFGTTEANIAATLNLPSQSAYSVPAGTITVDSAILVMRYADGFYGDSLTTSYKVNVYQLNEPIISGKSYYNTKAWTYLPAVLGTKTFLAKPKTGFYINSIVTGAADTPIHVNPQLRIKIDPTFVTTHFFGATTSQLNTNSVFQNYIKGLYLTLDKTRPGVGGNLFFNMSTDSCRLDVYYRANNSGTIDTAKVALRLGSPHAVQIKHDHTVAGGADPNLVSQLNSSATAKTFNTLYLQGLGGLRAKISFPYLTKILAAQQAAGNDIVLNRAELVVTPVAGTGIPYLPTPRLTMYRNDIALQRSIIPDAYSGDLHFISVGSFGGFYDSYHQVYHYIITGYIENLMRGKMTDYGTFIAPTDTVGAYSGNATVSISNGTDVGARAVVGGDKTSAYRMKLNIIYNKVTK
ncbi:DUF4270 family protein [Mucilaginibacter gracilis]|nr:DUF4270 family protein [Mucilaginibacter gracilis]